MERRRHQRFRVDVGRQLHFSLGSEVLDISVAGIGVRSTKRLEVGEPIVLSLGQHGDDIQVGGTVQWCRRCRPQRRLDGRTQGVFEAGVGFSEDEAIPRRTLSEFIAANAVVEPFPPIQGTYRLEDPDSLDIEDEHEFSVRRISVSGVMIEGQFPVAPESVVEITMPLAGMEFYSCGRVVTIVDTLEEAGRRVELGVEFMATSPQQRDALRGYVRWLVESTIGD